MAKTDTFIPILEERKKYRDYRQGIWGDSFGWANSRKWETIKHIVFHHSVTNPTNNTKQDVDYIAEIHKRNGWPGVGYHYVITADGMVWYVGDISTARANVANKNHLVIGVCLVGDFTKHLPTDEQILSAHDLANYLINDVPALVNVKGWESVLGHKELQTTACPGTNWKGVPDSIYERIKNRIPYTPQPIPEPVVDWEKRYQDILAEKLKGEEKFEDEKRAMIENKTKIEVELAEHKVDCQQEIDDLKEKLKNAEKENPKILSDKEIVDRAVVIILEKIKNKVLFFIRKVKKGG